MKKQRPERGVGEARLGGKKLGTIKKSPICLSGTKGDAIQPGQEEGPSKHVPPATTVG